LLENDMVGGDARLIYDFGMNVAEDTEFYLAQGYRVVAVEANPAMCAAARDRFASEIGDGRLQVIEAAIGDGSGELTFYVCNEESARSTASHDLMQFWTRSGETFREIRVPAISADTIVNEAGQGYYAKIDIEGHDLVCLTQIARSKHHPDYLSFEVDFRTVHEALDVCEKMGFARFALIDQATVSSKSIAAAEMPDGEPYRFRIGQSGPFAEQLGVPWLTEAALRRTIASLKLEGKIATLARRICGALLPKDRSDALIARQFPRTMTWYDVHAAR
jgi:FkbM family methyltransferase